MCLSQNFYYGHTLKSNVAFKSTSTADAALMRGLCCTAFLRPPDRPTTCTSTSLYVQPLPRLTRPRSPSTTPRHDEQQQHHLVKRLRLFLLQAAINPGWTIELEDLLIDKLHPLGKQALEPICKAQQQAEALTAEQLVELEIGLDRMLQLFSTQELLHLLQQQPQLVSVPLASWLDFFRTYGFSDSQIKNIVSQSPEVLTTSDVAIAGAAILRLKKLGFDNDEVRHRVVAYCPQVLAMEEADIDTLIRLWEKFRVGVDERAGPGL